MTKKNSFKKLVKASEFIAQKPYASAKKENWLDQALSQKRIEKLAS